jgi:hypothetical protein
MKKAVICLLLLLPLSASADKYEDVNAGLREILIALAQVSVQGKDASTFSQIQQGLVKMSKDVTDLQKEYKATQDEVKTCKDKSVDKK